MTLKYIKDIFARDIHRDIREVIKVDQADEEVIRSEIGEYVVTKTILSNFVEILEAYSAAPNKPNDRIAIWVPFVTQCWQQRAPADSSVGVCHPT